MTQRLLLFNPDSDLALGNNTPHYQPPASARQMCEDLACLPFWWAEEGDSIWLPSPSCKELWVDQMPLWQNISWKTSSDLRGFLGDVCPWGWNLSLRDRLLGDGICPDSLPSDSSLTAMRRLSSRLQAVKLLHDVPCSSWICGESVPCTSLEELQEVLAGLPVPGDKAVFMLKAPWSGSGKGLRRSERKPDMPVLNWCRRVLAAQQAVVVEPMYERVLDFAMEFYADGEGGVSFIGYSLFHSDANGVYRGNRLESYEEVVHVLAKYLPTLVLEEVKLFLEKSLADLLQDKYKGYLGVDMMICRFGCEPHFRLHPCVEINLRMNMGVLSYTLYNRWLSRGSKGRFCIDKFSNPSDLMADHRKRKCAHPLIIEDGRIKEGYMSLVPLTERSCYRAYVEVVSG